MIYTRAQQEFGTWSIPGRKLVIVYSTALLSRLADSARQSGSSPIGGALFGTCDETETKITHFRPASCGIDHLAAKEVPVIDESSRVQIWQQPAPGAGSAADVSAFNEAGESELGHLCDSYASDPELAGLQPVGWYRSRWDSKIQLNPEDLRVWNRFFPLPTQVALVLRVQENAAVRAGFFFRPQHGGPVRIDSSFRTFEIGPGPEATSDVGRLAAAVKSGGLPETAANLPPDLLAGDLEAPTPPDELFTPPERAPNRTAYIRGAIALAALMLIALLAWPWRSSIVEPAQLPPLKELALRFKGRPDRLKLVWNPKASLIREAASAELRIIDAESDTVELISAAGLAAGSFAAVNRSGLVEAQLRILARDGKRSRLTAAAQFVGPSAGDMRMKTADLGPIGVEQTKLQTMLDARLRANSIFADRIKWLKESLASRQRPAAERSASVDPIVPAVSNSQPPTPVVSPQQPAAPVAPPEDAAPKPASPPSATRASEGPAFGSDRSPSIVKVQSADAPVAPSYAGPNSGKFIWTGFLPAGGTVTIEGRRASSGSVNGSLPGVPVRITVYPAEFSTAGLSVFSALPRHQAGAVTEARSAQNGWMNTRYVYDPGRARDAQISAPPSEAGGFKQMQIRGGERPVSVVVVEWAVAR